MEIDQQPPRWCEDYVGIPFKDGGRDRDGADCWGLIRLIMMERAGLTVPYYPIHPDAEVAIHSLFETERLSGNWEEVTGGREQAFDVVEMLSPSLTETGWHFWSLHVGLVVACGWLIHTERATGALLMGYRTGSGVHKRINGFWRQVETTSIGRKPSV